MTRRTIGACVPGAEEHTDLALGRQRAPEPPHRRALAFLVRLFSHRMRLDMARIHPRIEQVDCLALARAIHAAGQNNDREPGFLCQIELRIEQVLAQFRCLGIVSGLVDLMTEFGRFKHNILPKSKFASSRIAACLLTPLHPN